MAVWHHLSSDGSNFTAKINPMKSIKYFFLVTLISLMIPSLFADNESSDSNGPATISISGTIIDKLTHETLPGVSIQLEDSEVKIYSDPDGSFSLKGLQPGSYKVKISCISYKDKEISVNATSLSEKTL